MMMMMAVVVACRFFNPTYGDMRAQKAIQVQVLYQGISIAFDGGECGCFLVSQTKILNHPCLNKKI